MHSLIEITADVEARGRNGFFSAHSAEVYIFGNDHASIEVFSKQRGDTAPIVLTAAREDLLELLQKIVDALQTEDTVTHTDASGYDKDGAIPRE